MGYAPVPHRPSGWQGKRVAGAVLALLAAAAALTGAFLPLFVGELRFNGETQLKLTVTGWDLSAEAAGPGIPTSTAGEPVRNGWALAGAGLLLLIAAMIGFAAARRASSPGGKFAAALAGGIGAGFLAATTLSIVLQAISLHESFRPAGIAEGNDGVTTADSLGVGFWLVAGATVLAIVAAALAAGRGKRAPAPPPPTYDYDPVTPRYGFPAQQPLPRPQPPADGGDALNPHRDQPGS
ncbi:hypothetical protein AMETH_0672 [Amycolatopsis methanolica 239]|uniref:Transmembrane protein n=2 Tax=Amycolatopsis methanolica TaxID=1814 RepID=A0A076MJ52_AMYME|nr:hypothetical protein AMETH_0672 [Amycolatopsis methanolica 239]